MLRARLDPSSLSNLARVVAVALIAAAPVLSSIEAQTPPTAEGAIAGETPPAPMVAAVEETLPAKIADSSPGDEAIRAELLNLLNRERTTLGLAPLAAEAALDRAAQHHAEDMVQQGYWGFTSPRGMEIERWIDQEGYRAVLVTEKLAQASVDQGLAELVRSWAIALERNRGSLFHPEARDLGVGLTRLPGLLTYVLVLARADDAVATQALQADPGDLEKTREEFRQRANEARRQARLPPLVADRALDAPAQDHAAAVLAALARGDDPAAIEPLGDRIQASRAGLGSWRGTQASLSFWKMGSGRIEPRLGYGQAIVVDAATPAAAVEAAASSSESSALLAAGFRRIGVGIAHGEVAGVARTVWVAALLRQ